MQGEDEMEEVGVGVGGWEGAPHPPPALVLLTAAAAAERVPEETPRLSRREEYESLTLCSRERTLIMIADFDAMEVTEGEE